MIPGGDKRREQAGSTDLCNFSAKSADPEFLKVKSESANSLAENDTKELFNKIIHIKVLC